jgi:hypothetical protein
MNPMEFEVPMGAGRLFVVPLPEGRYEFYQYQTSAAYQVIYQAREEFSIPFEIKPGRATYVGEVRAVKLEKPNLFGIRMPYGIELAGADAAERDQPLLLEKYRFLASIPFDIALVDRAISEAFPPPAQ